MLNSVVVSLIAIGSFGVMAPASTSDQPAEIAEVMEIKAPAEVMLPTAFNFKGYSAEDNARLNAAASCNPRSVVNSVPALRDCVIAGKIPACDFDFDADDVSVCPDGSLRFRVIIYNDCVGGPSTDVPIAEIFVCNCTVESWSCL
jgi:hypothetical protein